MEVVYIIIGVSGSGKTTLGKLLAEDKGLPFYDADDFHPKENVNKMRSGQALNDADRKPWLEVLSSHIEEWNHSKGAVLACSALKEKYRRQLSKGKIVKWIVLDGSKELIRSRMQQRTRHYMKPDMLDSQFDSWEPPGYGTRFDVEKKPEKLLQDVKNGFSLCDFAVIGLGTMGANLTRNLLSNSVSTVVFNRSDHGESAVVADFLAKEDHPLLRGTTELTDLVKSLRKPRKLLIMIPPGSPTDELLEKLIPLLEKGDIVIDGGNVHYRDSISRAEKLEASGIHYLGTGISGGSYGALHGPSIMVGGDMKVYARVKSILEMISARDSSNNPCVSLLGPHGSGHFVKMVHNGIEYAEMQLIAEVYAILKNSMDNDEISDLFNEWNKGPLAGYLIGISSEILRSGEEDNFILDMIRDEASSKGTGSWTVTAGLELGVATNLIHAAVEARYLSMMKRERVRISGKSAKRPIGVELPANKIREAYQAARIINHQQGFALLKAASAKFDWNLDLREIARVWTAGCILQSGLMNDICEKLESDSSIFDIESYTDEIRCAEDVLIQLTSEAAESGISLPCFSAAVQYWLGLNTEESTANLIQAQRDYFGAHGFRRKDDPEDKLYKNDWRTYG